MKYFFGFFLFILSFSFSSNAQTSVNKFTTTWVNEQNGLKQLSVRFCVSSNDGFIWLGTELGLYRYDGNKLLEIKDPKYPSLSKQRITRMGKDNRSGKIYIETSPDKYQYVIDNNKIERLDSRKYWKNGLFTFNDFYYTNSNMLFKNAFRNTNLERYLFEYSANTFLTAAITSNYIYLPQKSGLSLFDNKGLVKKFNLESTTGLVLLQFGETILATDKGKVTAINNGEISTKKINIDYIIESYINRNLINFSDIEIFGSKNNYFIKYKGGIYKIIYENDTLNTKFLFASPTDDITNICHLTKDNLYFIGSRTKGMAILKPNLFNTILFNENNQNKLINYCYSVIPISNKKWYSASGWTFDTNDLKSKVDDFLIDFRNSRFFLLYKNKVYFQAQDNLWNVENYKTDYDFNYPRSKRIQFAGFSGYTYFKGTLYISNPNGIYYLKDTNFINDENLNLKFNNKSINGIYSINNAIIIPTTKGVYRYIPRTKKLDLIKGLENVNARYIKPINKVSFWVGCYGEGLYIVNKNRVHKVVDKNIVITTAHAIEEDSQGNLWISTNDGLLKTDKKKSISKIYKNKPIECYRFSTENGLLTNEFNGSGTHPSLQTKDGVIGFASMKGFVWFQSQKVSKQLFKGNIVIDKVLTKNKVIAPIKDRYNLPKEVELISINFSFAYHFNRENLTVAYRFEDQKKWSIINGNTIQIPRYKKGNHKLIIRISTHGFPNNTAVFKTINLNFEAKFFETYWFWILITLLLFAVLYASYRIGIYLSKKREVQLKEKIKEKTAQLQEIVIDLENSQDSLTISLNEKDILLKEIHHRVKNNLQIIMSLLNIQASKVEDISIENFLEKAQSRIASMSLIHQSLYENETLDKIDFNVYINQLAINLIHLFGIEDKKIQIEITAKEIYLDLQTSISLGLILNELFTNALKYAFTDFKNAKISVSIETLDNEEFNLIFSDNGNGYLEKNNSKKSLGLELIELLALQLGGSIEKQNSKGTKYFMNFKKQIL